MDRFRPLVLVNRFWVAKRHWVIGGLVLVTVGSVAPAAVSVTNSLSVISAQKEQVKNYRQNLEAMTRTQGELEQELKRIGDERSRVVNAAVSGQGISEEELAYWRKQMDAFGLAKNMSLKVIGRGSSPYKQAVRIDVQIAPAGPSKALAPLSIAQALDFLQLYGYVENYDGNVATLHVKGM